MYIVELLLEIFNYVDDAPTQVAISCCCRQFSYLIRESLFSRLTWKHPKDLQAFITQCQSHHHINLERVTHSLTLQLAFDRKHTPFPVFDISEQPVPILSRHHSTSQYEMLLGLPPQRDAKIYIHVLNLKTAFRWCRRMCSMQELMVFEFNVPQEFDIWLYLADLPSVTTLILRENSFMSVEQETIQMLSQKSSVKHLILEANHTSDPPGQIPTVPPTVHWTLVIPAFRHLQRLTVKIDAEIPSHISHIQLPTLQELELFIGIKPPGIDVIRGFISGCENIVSIRILTRRGVKIQMDPIHLPNLLSYDGPTCLQRTFMFLNKVESVSIPENGYQYVPQPGTISTMDPLDDIIYTLETTPSWLVRKFTIHLEEYNGMFVHAVLRILPALCELNVLYLGGGPSEDSLVSFAGESLMGRVQNIEVVRIYGIGRRKDVLQAIAYRWKDESTSFLGIPNHRSHMVIGEPEFTLNPPFPMDDVKDILLGWSWRNMLPFLREVQFSEGSIWYRHGPGLPWMNN